MIAMTSPIKKTVDALTHSWRKKGANSASSKKQFRDAVLNHPAVRAELVNYINRLNLQGQINAGKITENQALKLFHDAGKDFMRLVNVHINNAFVKLKNNPDMDQTDLSNPINMQNQLSLPGSLANIAMNDVSEAIMNENLNKAQIAESENEQAIQTQQQSISPKGKHHIVKDLEKAELIGIGLKAIEDLKPSLKDKVVEDVFHKVTGIDGGSFDGIAKEAANKEESEIKTPFQSYKPRAVQIEKDIDKKK